MIRELQGSVFLISEMRSEQLIKERAQWGKDEDTRGYLASLQVRSWSHLLMLLTWANILQKWNKLSEIKKIIVSLLKLEKCGYDQEIYHVTRKQILGTTEINQGIQNRGVVLVSQGSHNKSPKTNQLETTETYSLSVLR